MSSKRGMVSAGAPSPAPANALARDLAATASGDHAAFERVYDATAPAVFGIALRVVRDHDLAAEIAQETFAEVWRKAPTFDAAAGSARGWVTTIAHRRAVDTVRSEQAHRDRLQREAATGADPDGAREGADRVVDDAFAQWEAARVRAGLRTLSPIQREALELAYYRGHTHREVAAHLGVPLGTAKSRLRDALARLRDLWEVEA